LFNKCPAPSSWRADILLSTLFSSTLIWHWIDVLLTLMLDYAYGLPGCNIMYFGRQVPKLGGTPMGSLKPTWCYRQEDYDLNIHSRAEGGGTMLQAGRSRVRVLMRWIFFNWPNPSSRTMAQGSTQPLAEVSTRNLPGV
jgi:hypothetical protein